MLNQTSSQPSSFFFYYFFLIFFFSNPGALAVAQAKNYGIILHPSFSFFKYKFIYFNWRLITLQYCIGFAIHQHESSMGVHVLPILNTPPSSLPVPFLWVIPVHQPQASSVTYF